MQRTSLPIILASQSPRRRQLLATTGLPFEVLTPDEEAEPDGEQPQEGESIAQFVQRMAFQKADNVAQRLPYPALVIGCDTVAEVDGLVLGKPIDQTDARRILQTLSGRRHSVWSGLVLIHTSPRKAWSGYSHSLIDMQPLDATELEDYLNSGEWRGKSGAFGYQDDHPWLKLIAGTAENVVGLPLDLLAELIAQATKME